MKKFVLFTAIVFITMTSKAQINEVGLFVGGSNYIGDIGPEYYINPNNLMGGVIYKWNLNPRIALRGTFTLTNISSDDADATNIARYNRGMRFTNSIKELAVGVEFNYFEYNLDDYRKTHTPYLLVEFAAFNYNVVSKETGPLKYDYESKTAYSIPFGIGYKTKLVTDFAPCLLEVPIQSEPVSPPPITITSLPVAKTWFSIVSPQTTLVCCVKKSIA